MNHPKSESELFITDDNQQSSAWHPLPMGHLLEKHGLNNRSTLLLFTGWILLLTACLYSVTVLLPRQQVGISSSTFQDISLFAIFYPPLLLSTLTLFWFGFEWGFIPAYLSTYIIAIASGMDTGWALLFGIAVVLGQGIYALTYYSMKIDYTLRSVSSLAVFVGVSFVASMASSLGSLVWCHIHELSLPKTLMTWKAWWTGTFLQTIILIGPILFLASPSIERWKKKNFKLPKRPDLSLCWVYMSIISVVTVLCIFIWANELLGSMRIHAELQQFPDISREAIIGAAQSFELTTWIAMAMAVGAGLGGIKLVGSWNHSLKKKVKNRTRQLDEKVQQFRATFEQAAVGVAHISMNGQFLKVNNKLTQITGMSKSALNNMTVQDLTYPDDLLYEENNLQKLKRGEMDNYTREKRYQSGEEPIWVNVSTSLVRDDQQRPWYFISVIEDISERKQFEHQLKYSLEEKETLLAEIHHRVKNNLAVVSALLELQANTTSNTETQNLLQHAVSRIKSMGMVHRLLYESESMANVDLKEYILELAETIEGTFSEKDQAIQLHTEMESVKMDINQAVPCGLITNELIINAYKHAFENKDTGTIYIRLLEESENQVLLQIKDNGVGLPENFDLKGSSSLGMKLIHTLTKQLDADLETKNDQGAVFNIRFTPELGQH